jgi:RNA polymerase sigma-70 factor (ECF subfamily)
MGFGVSEESEHDAASYSIEPYRPVRLAGTFRSGGTPMNSGTISYEEFAEVALSYFNQLHNAAQRLCRNSADADDLVQESYRLAFQHYRELRSLAHCRAWLYRILHRQAVTQHRRQRSGPPLVLIDGGADDSGEAALPATFDGDLLEYISLQEVRAAIEALPSDLRVGVTLCDIEGFTYAEIADITGCPVGTVRSRIARARAKLMAKLQTHAENCGIHRKTA